MKSLQPTLLLPPWSQPRQFRVHSLQSFNISIWASSKCSVSPHSRPSSPPLAGYGFSRRSGPRSGFWPPRALNGSITEEKGDGTESEELSVLTVLRSEHNEIIIVETPKSRILLLDSTHNIHSIYNKGEKWTGSYWDEFASLPAVIPKGPIGILGLGGGTAAHLMLDLWPSLKLEGWEIDGILIDKAREYLGLHDLEKCNKEGGVLHIHVGDALCPSAVVPGGFAGIVVDLFSDGKVLQQLQEAETWLELSKKLMPEGRIMVNCGGAHAPSKGGEGNNNSDDAAWIKNSTIKALCEAFPENLSWKKLADREGENYLALTGPVPNLSTWAALLPSRLSSNVMNWRPCF